MAETAIKYTLIKIAITTLNIPTNCADRNPIFARKLTILAGRSLTYRAYRRSMESKLIAREPSNRHSPANVIDLREDRGANLQFIAPRCPKVGKRGHSV